jgi:hypothetical protein
MFNWLACKCCIEKDKSIALLREEIAHLRDLTRPARVDNSTYSNTDYERDLIMSVKEDQSNMDDETTTRELEEAHAEAVRILTANY